MTAYQVYSQSVGGGAITQIFDLSQVSQIGTFGYRGTIKLQYDTYNKRFKVWDYWARTSYSAGIYQDFTQQAPVSFLGNGTTFLSPSWQAEGATANLVNSTESAYYYRNTTGNVGNATVQLDLLKTCSGDPNIFTAVLPGGNGTAYPSHKVMKMTFLDAPSLGNIPTTGIGLPDFLPLPVNSTQNQSIYIYRTGQTSVALDGNLLDYYYHKVSGNDGFDWNGTSQYTYSPYAQRSFSLAGNITATTSSSSGVVYSMNLTASFNPVLDSYAGSADYNSSGNGFWGLSGCPNSITYQFTSGNLTVLPYTVGASVTGNLTASVSLTPSTATKYQSLSLGRVSVEVVEV